MGRVKAPKRVGGLICSRARGKRIGRRERRSVSVRCRCEAQADEARPLDDDPLVDRCGAHQTSLYRVGLLQWIASLLVKGEQGMIGAGSIVVACADHAMGYVPAALRRAASPPERRELPA